MQVAETGDPANWMIPGKMVEVAWVAPHGSRRGRQARDRHAGGATSRSQRGGGPGREEDPQESAQLCRSRPRGRRCTGSSPTSPSSTSRRRGFGLLERAAWHVTVEEIHMPRPSHALVHDATVPEMTLWLMMADEPPDGRGDPARDRLRARGRRAARPRAPGARRLYTRGIHPTMHRGAAVGRCASTPASARPPRRTSATSVLPLASRPRRACAPSPVRTICRRRWGATATTRSRAARSDARASRSRRSTTWTSCSTGCRSSASRRR